MTRYPHHNSMEEEDQSYRHAHGTRVAASNGQEHGMRPYGQKLRAAFYCYLPDAPVGRFVTQTEARRYAEQIQAVIDMDQGGESEIQWTPREKDRLRALYRKWEARARGLDARFNAMGVVGGATTYRKGTAETLLDRMRGLVPPT